VLLRGVNLSGGSKIPIGMPSHRLDGFFDHRTVSFIGRPFPIEEADEHLGRLKSWGVNFLRFLVTWEAIEHAGPGKYDTDFFDYIVEVLKKAKEYGMKCLIDPHQDVWSRFSGGSGAPGWTLDLAGLNMRNFADTEAALVHNTYPNVHDFPKMIWSTNYYKLVAATMFTLFFAGELYAPKCIVDGVNIQEYLQQHYCDSYAALARRIHDEEGLEDSVVVGYDTLNEPSWGWVGVEDLGKLPKWQELSRGNTPTPFESMLLGEGRPVRVEVWQLQWYGFARTGWNIIDPKGKSAWFQPKEKGRPQEADYPWQKGPDFPEGCIWAGWPSGTVRRICYSNRTIFPETRVLEGQWTGWRNVSSRL